LLFNASQTLILFRLSMLKYWRCVDLQNLKDLVAGSGYVFVVVLSTLTAIETSLWLSVWPRELCRFATNLAGWNSDGSLPPWDRDVSTKCSLTTRTCWEVRGSIVLVLLLSHWRDHFLLLRNTWRVTARRINCLGSCIGTISQSRNCPVFYGTRCSLPCSQQLAISTYPEPELSHSHPPKLFR
jgi:hypothetical protein